MQITTPQQQAYKNMVAIATAPNPSTHEELQKVKAAFVAYKKEADAALSAEKQRSTALALELAQIKEEEARKKEVKEQKRIVKEQRRIETDLRMEELMKQMDEKRDFYLRLRCSDSD